MSDIDRTAFIRANTAPEAPALVPELTLLTASEITPLWQATEATLAAKDLPPPFWAFPWAGGQAVARHVLDHPELVRGARVLDFAAGSGLIAIAAAKAGAASVMAVEIDAYAIAAIGLNARLNGVAVTAVERDVVGQPLTDIDVVLVGDVCYEKPMAERVMAWLRALAGDGLVILMGDPGRTYLPKDGLVPLATYRVPTTLELEDRTHRDSVVWRVEA
ncbi:ribosomal L11 methyltransferase [Nitrospirillum viridazoti Y2]|uniref:Nicotinamide N-methyase n=1 Tax=Nitrospirillum amazonense TaxID=28077 RepID=A0A560ITD0_9PROT|nr:50S ribosomal protein L11 methyltransferase [Nitrospirillum amazonense]EGY00166.1 ribosomal L11 methyltransferase [Nitrospirillum amazonense Y2]TWB62087.1 putative nicotinamide N-methyase [Nitrospirillum amazonense]